MHPVTRGHSPPRSRTRHLVEQLVAERDALYRAAATSRAEVRALRAELASLRQRTRGLEAARDAAVDAHAAAVATRDAAVTARDVAIEDRDAAIEARDAATRASQDARATSAPAPEPVGLVEHRLRADLANLRRHRDQAVELARAEERAESAAAIAGIRDDLARALTSSPDTETPWAVGTRMVLRTTEAALARLGAEVFGTVGEAFAPERHEAVGQAPGGEAGRIASVQQVGILLRDGRLVRPARVIVSTGCTDA